MCEDYKINKNECYLGFHCYMYIDCENFSVLKYFPLALLTRINLSTWSSVYIL